MEKRLIRIIIGTVWLIFGVVILVNGTTSWWYSLLSFFVGLIFIYSAFNESKRK